MPTSYPSKSSDSNPAYGPQGTDSTAYYSVKAGSPWLYDQNTISYDDTNNVYYDAVGVSSSPTYPSDS